MMAGKALKQKQVEGERGLLITPFIFTQETGRGQGYKLSKPALGNILSLARTTF